MGIKLQGGNNSTNLASVNTRNQLQVVTPKDSSGGLTAGFVQLSSEVDAGTVLNIRNVLPFECSDDYRLRVGIDQSVFNSTFENINVNSQWRELTTTFSNTNSNGFYVINQSPNTASGSVTYYRTWRSFPTFGTYPVYLDMWIREANHSNINAISEWGFLYLTTQGTQQPIDGIYFRRISGGQLKGIITNNSSDIFEIDIDTSNVPSRDGYGAYNPSETNHFLISFHNDIVRFWINDVAVGEIQAPAQVANFTASSNLPVGLRLLNIGITPVARQLSIGYVNVGLGDQNVNKPWSHAMCGMGGGSYQVQQGNNPGPTVTRGAVATAGHPTSATARGAGIWSSTTGPGTVSLGGLWTSPAMSTLTSDADYPVFAYLNPQGTQTIPGKNLYVTSVRIGETTVTTAPGSTGAFISYIVQVENSSSVTSSSDTATTTSGKSIVIGGHGFGTTDVAGTMKPGFEMLFNPPLSIPTNKYFHIVARPFAVVSGAPLVVTGSVAVNGYWE